MIKNYLSLFLMLLLTLFFLGCGNNDDADRDNIMNLEMLRALQGVRAPQCTELKADFRSGGKVEGQNCTQNKAVINGWSLKCVPNGQCNNAARLAEVNAEAKQVCSNWCDSKNCDYTYSALTQCHASYCFSRNYCSQNCIGPLRDQCYFQLGPSAYNCECINPPPPPQEGPVES